MFGYPSLIAKCPWILFSITRFEGYFFINVLRVLLRNMKTQQNTTFVVITIVYIQIDNHFVIPVVAY